MTSCKELTVPAGSSVRLTALFRGTDALALILQSNVSTVVFHSINKATGVSTPTTLNKATVVKDVVQTRDDGYNYNFEYYTLPAALSAANTTYHLQVTITLTNSVVAKEVWIVRTTEAA
jgi:hypothetical protein